MHTRAGAKYHNMSKDNLRFRRNIPPTQPARGFQGRQVGVLLDRVLGPALKRRGFGNIDLINHWSTIVGPELAALSQPDRIRRIGKEGGVLTIRVEGAMALEVQHMAPQIIDRINAHYGSGTLARLHIVQGPLPLAGGRGRSRPLTKDEIEAARAPLEDMRPGRLQAALARLGAQIARDRKN